MSQSAFFDQTIIAGVDKTHDIFSLTGMSSMSPENKASVVMDLQMLIWSDFLQNRLPLLLIQSQMEEIQEALNQQKGMEELIDLIEIFVPNIVPLWLEFSQNYKFGWLKKYWLERYQALDAQFSKANEEAKKMLSPELQQAQQAFKLAEDEDWSALVALFQPHS